MSLFTLALTLLSAGAALVSSAPVHSNGTDSSSDVITCFPALNFNMPATLPKDNTQWWCDPKDEFAFLGFSYEVTACMCLRRMSAFKPGILTYSRQAKARVN